MSARKVNINQFNKVYFIGIGGIGMSALARYFKEHGWEVAGYDKTHTKLTETLENEGIEIHYKDLGSNLPNQFLDNEKTLVIYTPAIPKDMNELVHVKNNNFTVLKRSEVLGMITRNTKALGVAGTHGKTTTSSMLAHMLNESHLKCSAFLGGISTNFNSNFISSTSSDITVVEADEFDRSFLELSPFASIITSTDADHLDVYNTNEDFLDGFQAYANLTSDAGFIVKHVNVPVSFERVITYGIKCEADFTAMNLTFENGRFLFDVQTPTSKWNKVELGIPGIHNAENALSCIAMGSMLGLEEKDIRSSLKSFSGVKRRFEYHLRSDSLVYIDDYAHHPTELKMLISSVKLFYPNRRITGIFQPHLFSRTRDFFDEFAFELSRLDEVILLPIYPAREQAILGITSEALSDKITSKVKSVLSPSETIQRVSKLSEGVILTIGAGDIDRLVEPIKEMLKK